MYKSVKYEEYFLNMIKNGESEKVNKMLQVSFPFDRLDACGTTLLHYCVRYNNINVMKLLLTKGCNVNVQDVNGNTPLMTAVMENHDAAMVILLAAGADVLKLNNEKKSALHMLNTTFTIKCETIQTFLQVLRKQCSSSREVAKNLMDAKIPLYIAILVKDVEVIEPMLEHDAKSINLASPRNKVTALHVAVFINDLKIVKLLLKYGADVNVMDIFKVSPIYNVYKKYLEHNQDKIEILKILLERGALMTTCTLSGDLQVCHTLLKGNNEAIRVLIEAGLDFEAKSNRSNKTAIHYLAGNTNPGVAEELEPHVDKFDVNTRDKSGQTPVFISTYDGNVDMLKFFLENDAKTDTPHVIGATALHFAFERLKPGFEKQFSQCGEMLLQYDADPQIVAVNRSNGRKITIFDSALKRGHLNRIKPVVAHIAMLEKRGTFITETTRARINLHRTLKNYFERCQRLLAEKISGRTVLFDLLTVDEKRMARYLDNKNIVRKVRDKKYRSKMSNYRYYLNILNKHYVEGDRYRKLKNIAAKIVREIFRNRIDETHIVVENITKYLDDQSLQQLCKLSRPTGKIYCKI